MLVTLYSLALLLTLLSTSDGFGSGAPRSTCASMWPDHDSVRPQRSYTSPDGPYTISIRLKEDQEPATAPPGALAYGSRQIFEVTLSGSEAFKGFMIQARKVDGGIRDTVGTFGINSGSNLFKAVCNDNSITHRNSRSKRSVTVSWQAPQQPVGDINFIVTIVQNYRTFWVAIKSEVLYDSTQVTPAPPTTTATQTLAANVTDVCQEALLEPLHDERPHVAILCSNDSHCPCGWVCCPECVDDVTQMCVGYAICRKPRQLVDVVNEEIADASLELVGNDYRGTETQLLSSSIVYEADEDAK